MPDEADKPNATTDVAGPLDVLVRHAVKEIEQGRELKFKIKWESVRGRWVASIGKYIHFSGSFPLDEKAKSDVIKVANKRATILMADDVEFEVKTRGCGLVPIDVVKQDLTKFLLDA